MQTRESVMNKIILILLCFGFSNQNNLFYSYSTKEFSNPQIDSIMNQILISKQFRKLSDTYKFIDKDEDKYCGSEYKKARSYNIIDINNDNRDDVLVFFTLESMGCGNSYDFYMASIANNDNDYELVDCIDIGGKFDKSIQNDTITIQNNILTIPVMLCKGNSHPKYPDIIKVKFDKGFLEELNNE